MTTVAFFNNKGGVGKTALVYHLAWMLRECGRRVIAADLDPQANLTGMFLDETGLEHLWRNGNLGTIDKGIAPLFDGTGDIVEFSLQGLRNVGPTLRDWRCAWQERAKRKPQALDIKLPSGDMKPLGYVIMRHSIRLSRPVQAYGRWIDKIPSEYVNAVTRSTVPSAPEDQDPNCLAHLKDYRSLMPMAQEANRPMFLLKPADGAIGAHQRAVRDCYTDFQSLAAELLGRLADGC